MTPRLADTTPVNAIIYLRISQDRTGEGAGVERQREDALALCRQRGWYVVDIVIDNDVSASGKRKRPGFEQALAVIESGAASVLVAWHLDRLTRNLRDTVRLIETCQAREATVALVRGSDIDMSTPTGRMTAGILAMVARNETEAKSDRQKRANLQRAEAGKPFVSGHRRFGWEADGVTTREDEAAWIRKATGLVLAGVSLAQISRDMNHAEVTTVTGRRWTPTGVRSMLLRARNAGIRVHNDAEYPGVWEAVVTVEEFRAVQRKLTDPSRRTTPAGGKVHKHLGSRLYRCGNATCPDKGEGLMRAQYRSNKVLEYRCLTCNKSRRADAVDEHVINIVVERLSRHDAVNLLERGNHIDVMALTRQADALRDERKDLLSLLGTFTPQEIKAKATDIDKRLAVIEGQIADAGKKDVVAPLVAADNVRAVWEALSLTARRAVVDTLMTVTLLPARPGIRRFEVSSVRIDWKR